MDAGKVAAGKRHVVAAVVVLGVCLSATGQPAGLSGRPGTGDEFRPPGVSEAVLRALDAGFLTQEEAKDLRVFHGLWRESDLDTPARRARAALLVGAWDHEWLTTPEAPVLDRAEAMVRRGDLEGALEALAGQTSLRALRLRAEALELLGRLADADAALDVVVDRLLRSRVESAADLTEGVRALIARTRLRGPGREGDAAGDYQTLAALIARARDDLDRLHWPAHLAEAALVLDKDNVPAAAQALTQVVSMCPAATEAYLLLGGAAVGAFDFARAEAAADFARQQYERVDPEHALGTSPTATLILVRVRLRQGDPEEAAALMGPLLARFPRMREALALDAAIAAGSFQIEEARRRCEEFDAISPGSPLAYFEVGERLADDRQYGAASEFLGRAAERQPNWARAWIALGLLEMQSGRDAAAREALRRATSLDPFNTRARNSLTLAEEILTYASIQSEHFVVRYRPGVDEALALDMPAVLERIHARVCGAESGGIDFEPDARTVVELMPNQEWFAVRVSGMPGIHTMAASTGPVVAMASPQVGAEHEIGQYDWPRVLQHEYTHTVTLARTRNRIPHWFTEASAVNLEDAPRDYARWLLLARAVETGTLFPLDQIDVMFTRPRVPADRAQAYAQGHWMYEFILERWGARAPLDLMDLYAGGMSQSQAMRQVLGMESPEAFLEAFTAWARQDLVEMGLVLPDATPGMLELIVRDMPEGVDSRDPQPPSDDQMRSWLEEFPGHPVLLREMAARAIEGAGGEATLESVPALLAYAAACPADDMPHRALARLFLRTPGREVEAIPHLEFLDAREQRSAVYAVALAQRYAASGDLDAAASKAERATSIGPFDADHRELAARIALVRQDYATAERHIRALTIIEPDREVHQRRLERVREMAAGR